MLSVQPGALEAFHLEAESKTYFEILADLVDGELGVTLDGVPVEEAVGRALLDSLPRMGLALTIIIFAVVLAIVLTRSRGGVGRNLMGLFAFLPPYLPAFILLPLALSTVSYIPEFVIVLSIAATAAFAAAFQACTVLVHISHQPFVTTYRAYGLTELEIKKHLTKNILYAIAPSLERWFAQIIVSLMLAEAVFGVSGLGTLTIRAIQQTDVLLLMAIASLFAVWVSLVRLGAQAMMRTLN